MSVVVGVDDSPFASVVLTRAIDEARWRGTDLHAVHVSHLPMVYTEVAIDWEEVARAQRQAVWAALIPVVESSDVVIERVDIEGYPPDALVDYSNGVEADLLVVGTRGRGGLASLILGSTSHRAIQLARCDVLVVKPETTG